MSSRTLTWVPAQLRCRVTLPSRQATICAMPLGVARVRLCTGTTQFSRLMSLLTPLTRPPPAQRPCAHASSLKEWGRSKPSWGALIFFLGFSARFWAARRCCWVNEVATQEPPEGSWIAALTQARRSANEAFAGSRRRRLLSIMLFCSPTAAFNRFVDST